MAHESLEAFWSSPEGIAKNVIAEALAAGEGDIILLGDGGYNSMTPGGVVSTHYERYALGDEDAAKTTEMFVCHDLDQYGGRPVHLLPDAITISIKEILPPAGYTPGRIHRQTVRVHLHEDGRILWGEVLSSPSPSEFLIVDREAHAALAELACTLYDPRSDPEFSSAI